MDWSWIPEALIGELAVRGLPIPWQLAEIARNHDHPLRPALQSALGSLREAPRKTVLRLDQLVQKETDTASLTQGELTFLGECIERAIYERRYRCLTSTTMPPPPYNHPSLADLEPDSDLLVRLSDLDVGGRRLERRGFVFSICRPLPEDNSHYWTMSTLLGLPKEKHDSIWIRLDPLVVVPVEEYVSAEYRMLVWGQKLNWERIAGLRQAETARWIPNELTDLVRLGADFTDIAWIPRSDEIHLQCEEVPRDAEERPARYLHAVYNPRTQCFTHVDAAIRFYTPEGLRQRKGAHLKDVGKQGIRVKLYRVDGELSCDSWASLAESHFVWNNDVSRYVRGEREFAVEHSPLLPEHRSSG